MEMGGRKKNGSEKGETKERRYWLEKMKWSAKVVSSMSIAFFW